MNSILNKFFKTKNLPGFTLIDVMIGMVITGIIVLLIALFVRDMLRYSYFVANHQQIRQESFALVNNLLAAVLREAVAVDYTRTNDNTLVLYMDKLESKTITITVVQDLDVDKSQLVIDKGGVLTYLNSPKTFVTEFAVQVLPESVETATIKDDRSYQPMVEVYLAVRMQKPENRIGQPDKDFFAWELPRISYASQYTLRNYSYSSLQH